ncbi:histidine--tRNA ligase [Candidatus Uhrbacteria bacterium CG10_big_fil_rev_8_21_14_0_10_48_11]|uniref:Histidine--tRNA ligase n=1 Tax=Candidatus Uhrbacteria bacterium CG10_big_fil_rev_8_21_14_0_10_48_11 TaxID=1975037 RepID=A0A2M8LF48_9BACT|nr:MAG: histidine--tRNA ligase [Candidatus Uhrbacteria bacterium CG10_big_fil_rev_8_21_14_0_10_48_11]
MEKKTKMKTSKPQKAKRPAVATSSTGATDDTQPTKGKRLPQTIRGFRDILPEEQAYWRYLATECEQISEVYGFQPITLPIVEATSLFERAVGKVTDIVEKEMFSFTNQGNESLTLRPEPTAGMARAYLQHGLINQPQPVKWYTIGPMFRYQRPQYGRQRQFHQWGCEVIGDNHPTMDATLMLMATNLFQTLGLPTALQVNSIGDKECRPVYRKALLEYYRGHRKELCEDCERRLGKNPLRLLDCKEEGCRALRADAPQFVDHLCTPCRDHFMAMLEYLDDLDVPYVLNPHLVRGLDYYTRTVFEVWAADDESGKTALAGGGRYDDLLAELGGRPTPAVGIGLGMETVILKMKEREVSLPPAPRADVFIAQLSQPARKKAMLLFEELRKSNVRVSASFSKDGLKPQMEMAARLGVRYTIIIGQKEIVDHTAIVRDMEAGMQETFDFKKIINIIQHKLEEEAPIIHTEPLNQKPEEPTVV